MSELVDGADDESPFPLPVHLTPNTFVEAIVVHWRAGAGAGMLARIGHVCLKAMTLVGFITRDALNPWWCSE